MASKIFIDANILLDFLLKRLEYETAKEIIGLGINKKFQAFITPSIIHICGYWLTKAYGSEKAKDLLLELLNDITVIDISHEITVNALNSRITDIEDALQYYTGLQHKIDYFISNDRGLKKAAIPVLPVFTSEEFIVFVNTS